jgi:SUKH-4 immunity protein
MNELNDIRNLLTQAGLPEIQDDPEALVNLSDSAFEALDEALDRAEAFADAHPDNEDVIELIFMAHMTKSMAFFLRSVTASSDGPAAPTPAEIRSMWPIEELQPVPKHVVQQMAIPSDAAETLISCGLPAEAEPGCVFYAQPMALTDHDAMASDDEDYRSNFQPYWVLGENIDGNPICIDERGDGLIVMLDKDFGLFSSSYVNNSVGHLLASLRAYDNLLASIDPKELVDNWPDVVAPEPAREAFYNTMLEIDPGTMMAGAFWAEELLALSGDID